MGARIRSGTSRQAGTPRSSCERAVSAAVARQRLGHAGVERGAVRRVQRLRHQPLQFGVERDHVELLHRAVDLLHDGRRQVHADAPRQFGGVGGGGSMLGQALDDGAHVADVHAFFQQQLQHLLHGGDADHLGNHVFHQFGCELGDMVDQRLGLDAAQQARGIHLHQV